MKRFFIITIITTVLLSMIITLSGCSESNEMKKYTAYAIGVGESEGGNSNTVTGIKFYESNDDNLQEPEEKTITLSFLGKEYVANYSSTSPMRFLGSYYTYITSEKDIIKITSSGDLVEFNSSLCKKFYLREYSCSDDEAEKIKARAIEVASNWVKEIYGDSLEFEYIPKVTEVINSNALWVTFKADYTPDPDLPYNYSPGRIKFHMTIDCELLSFYASNTIGKFKEKEKNIPEDFTLDTVRELVSKMATDSNTKIELQCDVNEAYEKKFDVLQLVDGRLICRTYVYVNGNTENRVEVIIPLE